MRYSTQSVAPLTHLAARCFCLLCLAPCAAAPHSNHCHPQGKTREPPFVALATQNTITCHPSCLDPKTKATHEMGVIRQKEGAHMLFAISQHRSQRARVQTVLVCAYFLQGIQRKKRSRMVYDEKAGVWTTVSDSLLCCLLVCSCSPCLCCACSRSGSRGGAISG